MIPRPLLRSLIALLATLSTQSHSSIFVTPFLASSRQFYHLEGTRLSSELEPSTYLSKIESRLSEEGERCDTVLGTALKGSILRVVLEEMVNDHVEGIVDKGEFCRSIYFKTGRTDLDIIISFGINDRRRQASRSYRHLYSAGPSRISD